MLLARDVVAADGEAVGVANVMEDRLLWVGVRTLVEGTRDVMVDALTRVLAGLETTDDKEDVYTADGDGPDWTSRSPTLLGSNVLA